ncbi:MAG: hypothetical protein LBL49_04800 [Clostridiales Family XIII bacterium]|jgi:hypothetical protein|nr:hypothetical protein [Clostridiales Family XIII bacterium]
MAYTCVYNGIVFIEGDHPDARSIQAVSVDLSFKFGAQLKNLNSVKTDLAAKVAGLGGNCLLNFTYGQKSRWLAIDDVAFWGKGIAAVLPPGIYQKLSQSSL